MLRLHRFAEPDPDVIHVAVQGHPVPVALRRLRTARRMTLRVQATSGDVTLTVPTRASLAGARAFLERQGAWIAARRARVPGRVPLSSGEVIPFRGEPHRIVHWSLLRAATKATRDADGQAAIAVSGDEAGIPSRVRRFLAEEAGREIGAAVSRHAGRLGVAASRITLRDTTSRWGSCSSRGSLSFSWRLILAPPAILDYLAAHEVAHLKELNHSHRFWTIVHDLCPDTEEAERWLTRHGSGLHRYG